MNSPHMEELIATEDGSLSLLDAETGELQHNRAGAYTEAFTHYVSPASCLERLKQEGRITVLDACFGLGYNSLVLMQEAIKQEASGHIEINAVELNPEVLEKVPIIIASPCFARLARFLPKTDWHAPVVNLEFEVQGLKISLNLVLDSLQNMLASCHRDFDYVFHDPYSPRRAPELWTLEIFQSYFALLKNRNGCLLTYSSAYAVRGGLSLAGFKPMKTASLGGKSGGTLALVQAAALTHGIIAEELDSQTLSKLSGASGVPYRGTPGETRESVMQRRQAAQSRQAGD